VSEEVSLTQNSEPAVLFKIETDLDAQVYLAELELDEGLHEVVFHVFDVTLKNFVAKRISLSIQAVETPFAPPT
jgi:hypothetical protein